MVPGRGATTLTLPARSAEHREQDPGSVSVVAPLAGTTPLFVLALSRIFLRDLEPLSVRLVVGTLLIVLGVYLITAL